MFQNPLVDPHIIGVTAGSAFGGTLAILLGVGSLLMMASTFFFGLVALGLIYALAALQGRDSTLGLILSGIILSGFFAALVSLMQYLADSEETLPNIVFWLLGSFATASWHKVLLMSLPLAVAAGALWKLRWRINLLALEERDARSLGVPVAALRRGVLVAAQVAVSGSIAWMGLVVPHLARLLVGADHRRLLPTAFWLGAALMLVVDDLARTLTQAEIPIGIITALLGAPLFTGVAGAIPTPEYDPMNSSLSLQALRYGHRQPLFAPLTLACRPGEIWAVLGANGRGKKYPAGYPDRRAAAAGRRDAVRGRRGPGSAVVSSRFSLARERCGADGPGPSRGSLCPAGRGGCPAG
ncbi:putative ABC transport system permease component [Klebsiella pneumoniae]|uniref:Putative ABC transport system permease component n=1 Tax=Klebsiella pneumoniae TaxID=573 RepID=A0A2X1RK32_KLEPN|nr:putative ABC transport system permease component [Klebsiella pneumoniae]